VPDAGNTLQQGSHAAAMWPVVTVTVATSSLLCGAFTFFYKTYQPAQYIPDCVNFPFSALTLLVGWQEGHPTCNKTEWWGAGVFICLERGADLHMARLMPLPLTVSCFSKIQIGFTFLVPADPGSPGQRAVKRVCV